MPYAIGKGGVVQLTRALAAEFLKRPLRVNAIAPAGTNANLATETTFPADMDVDLVGRMAGLRGLAEPQEVAGVRLPRLGRGEECDGRRVHDRQWAYGQLTWARGA